MFKSVVIVAFQSVFHSEMHQNNIYYFLKKIIFDVNHQNNPKNIKQLLKTFLIFMKHHL